MYVACNICNIFSIKFDMMTSIQIKSSVIKLKSDMQVLKIQLNMKL